MAEGSCVLPSGPARGHLRGDLAAAEPYLGVGVSRHLLYLALAPFLGPAELHAPVDLALDQRFPAVIGHAVHAGSGAVLGMVGDTVKGRRALAVHRGRGCRQGTQQERDSDRPQSARDASCRHLVGARRRDAEIPIALISPAWKPVNSAWAL